MTSPYDVFISYAQPDIDFVRKLVVRLQLDGFAVFFDQADIAVGSPLAEALEAAVKNARFVFIVMSPDYFASDWATLEWQMAMSQEADAKQLKLIPLLYRECKIPPLLGTKVYADCRTDEAFERYYPDLIKLLADRAFTPYLYTLHHPEEPEHSTIGSIAQAVLESTQLKDMIGDLKEKVDAFIEKADAQPTAPTQKELQVDPTLCFVVMPFGSDELKDVYEYFVKPSIETNCNLRCERGDDVFGSNVIMEDIRSSIEQARVVVADLTGRNPNVFYEVGIAHTLYKDVLLLSQSMNDVPFDLRHLRVLLYEYTPKGCKRLEGTIADNINAIVKGGT